MHAQRQPPGAAARLAWLAQAPFLQALATSPEGLSRDEAARRLARYGPNVPATGRSPTLRKTLTSLFNPLLLILLLAAGVSAALGDLAGASMIAAMVALSLALDFVLGYRSQQAGRAPAAGGRADRDGAP
jgi:magnesium-transporting ATPase (P-type)